jgi:FkbM family methyltransferase
VDNERLIWPPDFTYRESKLHIAELAAARIAALSPQRRVVVQAGGCAGLWPRALAKHFEAVYTFEPEATNFQCLVHNCDNPCIYPFRIALGDRPRTAGLDRHKAGAGLWRLAGDGSIPVLTLDSFCLPACDALVLDVEGSELDVLRGAGRTIATHRPLLWFEFMHGTDALAAWLSDHGYDRPRLGLQNDWYSLALCG